MTMIFHCYWGKLAQRTALYSHINSHLTFLHRRASQHDYLNINSIYNHVKLRPGLTGSNTVFVCLIQTWLDQNPIEGQDCSDLVQMAGSLFLGWFKSKARGCFGSFAMRPISPINSTSYNVTASYSLIYGFCSLHRPSMLQPPNRSTQP